MASKGLVAHAWLPWYVRPGHAVGLPREGFDDRWMMQAFAHVASGACM